MYNPNMRQISREKFEGAFRRSPLVNTRLDTETSSSSFFQRPHLHTPGGRAHIPYSKEALQSFVSKRSRSKDYIINHDSGVFSTRHQNKENHTDHNHKQYQTSNPSYGNLTVSEKNLNDKSSLGNKLNRPPRAESREQLNSSKIAFQQHNLLHNRAPSRVFARKPTQSPAPNHKQFYVLDSSSRPRDHTPQGAYDSHASRDKLASSSMLDLKNVSLHDLDIQKEVGKGSYAVVKLAVHKATRERFAVKTYEKVKLADPLKKTSVEREIAILQKLNHPSIIRYVNHVDSRK